jgi:enoyl-CoA hydratase
MARQRKVDYSTYEHLRFSREPNGVLVVTIHRPERLNATHEPMHTELANVFKDIAEDAETRVAVVTGAGNAFSAGGDLEMVKRMSGNFDAVADQLIEASDLVYNILNCDKPIISAINGIAVGAGLAAALLADISIIAEDVRLTDGHLRLGVVAGDHAVIIWPLLCGMAKAKYYLLTADFLDGREAERIGLVSKCVPREELMDTAMSLAQRLATSPQHALRWTKRALNNWIRMAGPAFDASIATEMLTFFGPDVREGADAILGKRQPQYPSAS